MRTSITYKSFTLAIGVLVALLVVLSMWMRTPEGKSNTGLSTPFQINLSIPSAQTLVENTLEAVL